MRGYTLIEILIVIGITSVVVGLAVPVSISQLSRNRAIDAAAEISSNLFLYQQYSYSKKDGKRYGARINAENYEMVISEDETIDGSDEFVLYEYPDKVTVDVLSDDEFFFDEGGFRPSEPMNFSINYGSASVVIEINSQGLISYYID